jgi:hypothetical protein
MKMLEERRSGTGGGGKSRYMTPKGKLIAIGGNEDKGKEPEAGHNTKVFTHKFIEEGICAVWWTRSVVRKNASQ